ncbi:MAG: hypothetical protein LBG09_01775 [Puniceicoccales bacterium]|jgi:general secretion pathway protein D|nr:hypothetical protein [Puniceicoccales bacterium]
MWFRFFLLLFAAWGLSFGGVLAAPKEAGPEVIELVGPPKSEQSSQKKDFVDSPANASQNADRDISGAEVSENFTKIPNDISNTPPLKPVEKQPENTAISLPEKSAAEPVKKSSTTVKLIEKQSENTANNAPESPGNENADKQENPAATVKISPKRINYLALKARSLLLVGDTEEASAIAKSILQSDPQNKQALAIEIYVKQKQLEPGADFPNNAKEARNLLLRSVQDTWQTPKISLENVKTERDQETSSAIFQRLNRIIIPKISLSSTPLTQAINTLAALSEQCDPDAKDQQKSGINMVVMLTQNAVEPTLTLNLKNMPLDKILDFIAKASSYQFDIEDEVVIFRKTEGGILENLETKFFKISRSAIIRMTGLSGNIGNSGDDKDKKKESSGASSSAEEERLIKEFLQKAGVNFSSTPGSNLAFDGSQLIVTQTLRNIKRTQEILAKYEQIKQVEIETKFIEITQGKLDELQLGWASGFSHRGTAGANPALPRSATLGTQQDGNNNLRPLNEAFTIRNASSGAGSIVFKDANGAKKEEIPIPSSAPTFPGGLNLGSSAVDLLNIKGVISDSINLGLTLRALEQQSNSDLMSAPKLTVLSGKTAKIVVAQEFIYPKTYGEISSDVGTGDANSAGVTITAGTPSDFQTRNVGVEMNVTPIVEENNCISLQLAPRVTEFEGFMEYGGRSLAIQGGTTIQIPPGFYQPIFSTREIQTEVTIYDGATVVMGGLTREEIREVHDKIPLLGDIPLIGKLFRSKGETTQKKNLLIFVTANILSPGGTPIRSHPKESPKEPIYRSPKEGHWNVGTDV